MAELRFTRDADKASSNERKHGVTFEEAQSAFYDQDPLQLEDPGEAAGEERFVMLGLSGGLRMLTVAHCVRAIGR